MTATVKRGDCPDYVGVELPLQSNALRVDAIVNDGYCGRLIKPGRASDMGVWRWICSGGHPRVVLRPCRSRGGSGTAVRMPAPPDHGGRRG